MAKTQRQPFTPRGPFVVARPFRWEGRDYKPGEDFNAQRMAVNQRRLRLLYDAKSIDVKGDYVPAEPEAAEENKVQDLTKLDKKELMALAAERGITVDDKATKAQIIAALQAPADDTPGPGYVHLPTWLSKAHLAELQTEARDAKGHWAPARGRRNETWDLLIYCDALWHHLGAERIHWERPPVWAAEMGRNSEVISAEQRRELRAAPRAKSANPPPMPIFTAEGL